MHGVAVTLPSTAAEHRDLVIRGHAPANAAGRSAGRCEHHDRAIVRSRDTRPDVRCVRGAVATTRCAHAWSRRTEATTHWRAHATRAAAPAPSRHGRRDARHGACSVAGANHWIGVSCDSPRSCRGLRTSIEEIRSDPDASHDVRGAQFAVFTRARAPRRCHARSSVEHERGSLGRAALMPCTEWPSRCRARRRAPRPRDSRSRSRECSRQVRGEVRAPRPRDRALTRHATRCSLRPRRGRDHAVRSRVLRPRRAEATTHWRAHATRAAAPAPSRHGRRDARHGACSVAGANHWVGVSCVSPRSCRGLRTSIERSALIRTPRTMFEEPSSQSSLALERRDAAMHGVPSSTNAGRSVARR
jgi:hypothetical protein